MIAHMSSLDHPIFRRSLQLIQAELGYTGLNALQQQVLERVIHSSGDFSLKDYLSFSSNACELGIDALMRGAPILTDTEMAAAAVRPMSARTINAKVLSMIEWAPKQVSGNLTRTSIGMDLAWNELTKKYSKKCSPIVVIGSSPTALEVLLMLVSKGYSLPSLTIGMPVGFVGVQESKENLFKSDLPHICIRGSRGGASLAAAAINALMRACVS